MEHFHSLICQCQPIAKVNVLGAQITHIELSFLQPISAFSLSQVCVWVKSLNTQNEWIKLDLNACHQNNESNFILLIQPDAHCLATKLLYFDIERFTQVWSELQLKIELDQALHISASQCNILPILCLDTQGFTHFTYQDLTCSFYQPKASSPLHPLIICLHGAGEGGNNQSNILADKIAVTFASQSHQETLDYPYILAPQCPSFWVDKFPLNGRYYYGERDYTADLLALIQDTLMKHQDIDPKRIYIVGGSMGGYQGLRLFSDAPDLFAAALIACPAKLPATEKLHHLKDKKIWLIHSELDEVVSIENTRHLLKKIHNEQSTMPMFTLYKKVIVEGKTIDPHCVFLPLYDNQLTSGRNSIFEWLSEQSL